MITFSPLPKWKHLLACIRYKFIDEKVLTKLWCNEGDKVYWTSRTAWSLQAIAQWLEQSLSKKNPIVWIPDYFCNDSLRPLRKTSAKLIFYPIAVDLTPDWQACEQLAKNNKPDIFVLTHYFGEVSPVIDARKFCDRHRSLFVEDAAQLLMKTGDVGEKSDIVLYSPHKLLAIPHGAICVLRPSAYRYMRTLTNQIKEFKDCIDLIGLNSPPLIQWIVKRIVQKTFGAFLKQKKIMLSFEQDGEQSRLLVTPQMSFFAKKMLFSQLTEIPMIVYQRQQCVSLWHYLLLKNSIPVENLNYSTHHIPYIGVYPIKQGKASIYYDQLRNKYWPVSSWPDLAPEVKLSPELHHVTLNKRNNTFFIAVNQSLDLIKIAAKFSTVKPVSDSYNYIEISKEQWQEYFNSIEKSNLTQSWCYGDAKAAVNKWKPIRYAIYKNNCAIAIVQILTKNILGVLCVSRINRGPLWLIDVVSSDEIKAVYNLLRKNQQWYKRQLLIIAPNVEINAALHVGAIYHNKYRSIGQSTYRSIWIDLSKSETELRQALRPNWRNKLVKAEKSNLVLIKTDIKNGLSLLLDKYTELQKLKAFNGISSLIIDFLAKNLKGNTFEQGIIFEAHHENDLIALILVIKHGLACTYLIGWSDRLKGQGLHPTNFLLWNALLVMKQEGCLWCDLGGISEETPELSAITTFKKGLSGQEYALLGEHLVC